MGLDLWFREDVARILASAGETMRMSQNATAPLDAEMAALYQQGFGDALRAVAVAFGVRVSNELTPGRPAQTLHRIESAVWRQDANEDGGLRRNGS